MGESYILLYIYKTQNEKWFMIVDDIWSKKSNIGPFTKIKYLHSTKNLPEDIYYKSCEIFAFNAIYFPITKKLSKGI